MGDSGRLESAGFTVQSQIGSIYTGTLEASRLGDLVRLPEVVFVRRSQELRSSFRGGPPALLPHSLRPAPKSPAISSTPTQAYSVPAAAATGAGVLVAFIDTGVDIFHQDFRRNDGSSRIKFLLDLSDPGDVDGNGTLDGSGPYGGTLYSEADINAALAGSGAVRQKDTTGHGTHGLSIAAGDDPSLPGMAPEADLIVVKATRKDGTLSFESADVVNALAFVDQKAGELGKPYVVNLSLGTIFSSHDGRSLEEQAIDALVGPGVQGKAIVVAAGNSSDNRASRYKHFTGTAYVGIESSHVLRVPAYAPTPGRGNDKVFLDLWYEGRDKHTLIVRPPVERSDCAPVEAPYGEYADVQTACGDVFIGNMGGANPSNGDTEALVLIDDWTETAPASGDWTVVLRSEEVGADGVYHGWVSDDSRVGAETPHLVTNADNLLLVGKPGSAYHAITVGSFAKHDPASISRFKMTWLDVNSQPRVDDTAVQGDISDFSSPGKTRDGRVKPELAAPGERVLGAVSRDAYPPGVSTPAGFATSPGSIYQYRPASWPADALINDRTPNHGFGLLQGTSFAAPVVTGVAARILSSNPNLDAIQVRNMLINSAIVDGFVTFGGLAPVPNNFWGYGKLDTVAGTTTTLPSDLRITTDVLSDGVVNEQYNAVLTASGGMLPYTWRLAAGTLPVGLTFEASGFLTGKPTTAGSYTFTVAVTDSSVPAKTASRTYKVQVSTSSVLQIVSHVLPIASIDRPYEERLLAEGGTPPYGWSVTGGELPPGLTLASDGKMNGVPTTLGSYSFTLQVQDAALAVAARSLRIRVATTSSGEWQPLGISGSAVSHLAWDPNDKSRAIAVVGSRVFETKNEGLFWDFISANNGLHASPTQIEVSPASMIWLAGERYLGSGNTADFLQFHPTSSSWETRLPSVNPYSVLGVSGFTTRLAGGIYLLLGAGPVPPRRYFSVDDGKTWESLGFFGCDPGSSSACPGLYGYWNKMWLGTSRANANILYASSLEEPCCIGVRLSALSTDGGRTFVSNMNNSTGYSWVSPSQTDALDVVKLATNYIERSSDGGRVWTFGAPAAINGDGILVRSESTPSVLYLGGSGGGLFRSNDTGTTWAPRLIFGKSPSVTALAVHPLDADQVMVGTPDGVFLSTDGGSSWSSRSGGIATRTVSRVVVSRARPTDLMLDATEGYYLSRSSGNTWTLSGSLFERVSLASADPDLYYAVNAGAVYRSTNHGINWQQPNSSFTNAILIAADPFEAAVVMASKAGSAGTFRSTDRGVTWVSAYGGLPFDQPTDLVFAQDRPGRVYIAFNDRGIYRSDNRGDTWSAFGLNAQTVSIVVPAPSNSEHVYAYSNGQVYSRAPGGSWQAASTGPPANAGLALAVEGANPSVAYAGADHPGTAGNTGGIYKTTDGGRNWSRLVGQLDSFDVVSIATHPTESGKLWAATREGGVFYSEDGGATWTNLDRYGTIADLTTVTVKDPSNPNLLFAGTEGYGVQASTDGGRTFVPRVTGLQNYNVNAIIFDPITPSTMYAGTDAGIYKSTDSANTWSLTAQSTGRITDIVIDTDGGTGRLIWGTVEGQGVARSLDQGATFQMYSSGLASLELTSLELDHTGAGRLIWGTTLGGDGVVYSDDDGLTWKAASGNGLTDRNVTDIKIQSGSGRLIWGTGRLIWGTTDSGVFYSRDGGQSWTELSLGLPPGVPVTSASIDPNTDEVFVSLFSEEGGGVYRGGNVTGVWTAFNAGLDELKVKHLTNDGGRVLDATTKATTFFASTAGQGVYAAELRSYDAAAPRITTTALANGTLRAPYTQSLTAADGTPPYRWAVIEGALPPGLTLEASGLISGNPGALGSFGFRVQVADQATRADTRSFTLTVQEGATLPGLPQLSIADTTLVEGNSGSTVFSFTVTVAPAPTSPVTVGYLTASGTASSVSDYTAASGTLTFTANQTTKAVLVNVRGDTALEPDETFFVNLSGAVGASVFDGQAKGTIANDDGEGGPGLSIDDRAVREGNALNAAFRVALSSPVVSGTVTVNYATAPGTAMAPGDFASTSGTLTFTPGRTVHSIYVPIMTDATVEGSEQFYVNLTNPSGGASILDGQGVGTIDDPPGSAKIAMYRSYNRSTDYHFFTTDLASKDFAVNVLGFQDESNPIPFYVSNVFISGTVPLFRMYSPNLGRHFYTASAGSRDFLMGIGVVYEKEEGWVYPLSTSPQPAGTTELFMLYNNNSGTHLFTADPQQKDGILSLFAGIWVQHTSVGLVFTTP